MGQSDPRYNERAQKLKNWLDKLVVWLEKVDTWSQTMKDKLGKLENWSRTLDPWFESLIKRVEIIDEPSQELDEEMQLLDEHVTILDERMQRMNSVDIPELQRHICNLHNQMHRWERNTLELFFNTAPQEVGLVKKTQQVDLDRKAQVVRKIREIRELVLVNKTRDLDLAKRTQELHLAKKRRELDLDKKAQEGDLNKETEELEDSEYCFDSEDDFEILEIETEELQLDKNTEELEGSEYCFESGDSEIKKIEVSTPEKLKEGLRTTLKEKKLILKGIEKKMEAARSNLSHIIEVKIPCAQRRIEQIQEWTRLNLSTANSPLNKASHSTHFFREHYRYALFFFMVLIIAVCLFLLVFHFTLQYKDVLNSVYRKSMLHQNRENAA